MKVREGEEEPERQNKRRHFWQAVDALKSMAKEGEDYILEPSMLKIFDAKDVQLLGVATEDGFEWNADVIGKQSPKVTPGLPLRTRGPQ